MKKLILGLAIGILLLAQSVAYCGGGQRWGMSTVTMTSADTEYSLELPSTTKSFTIVNNSAAAFRISNITGQVATPTGVYAAIPAGGSFYESDVNLRQAITVYAASSTAGTLLTFIYFY